MAKLSILKLVGIAAFLILVVALIGAFSGKVSVAVTPGDVASADGGTVDGQFATNPSNEPKFGASSAPGLVGACADLNGTMVCYYGSAWSTASTSCSFKLPGATTTLQFAAAQVNNQRGTANQGEWGWSRDVMSTSTSLGLGTFSATIQTSLIASTTGGNSQLNSNAVLPPGGYLTFKQGSTTNSQTGRCSAEVIQI